MNIQDYISSGIIESYVLGLASEQEKKEFEQMAAQYPEIKEARLAFELALEKQAMSNAINPPASLKNNFLSQITALKEKPEPSSAVVREISWWKYAVAASVILLVASVYWNISLYSRNKNLETSYNEKLAKLNDMENDMHVLQNPHIKMASMNGMDISPQSHATVFWDTTTHDVYLLINNLPTPASDKQYQLWAIFNKKPVDLGVFDIKKEKLLIQAKNTQGAEAFAITLEKRGGSPDGPKGDMYVKGDL